MSKVDDFIAAARAELGSPYTFSEEGPDEFDCSGLVQYTLAKVGVRAPRTAAEQQRWAAPVSGTPLPGDLVFWNRPASHVGIYIGSGKMIAASSSADLVRVQDVYGTPAGYGRVPGLGTALAPAVGLGTDLARGLGEGMLGVGFSVSDALGVARRSLMEIAVVVLGVGLLGLGVWRAVATRRPKEVTA